VGAYAYTHDKVPLPRSTHNSTMSNFKTLAQSARQSRVASTADEARGLQLAAAATTGAVADAVDVDVAVDVAVAAVAAAARGGGDDDAP